MQAGLMLPGSVRGDRRREGGRRREKEQGREREIHFKLVATESAIIIIALQ